MQIEILVNIYLTTDNNSEIHDAVSELVLWIYVLK